ncbi:hypothetical protein [Sinorhizobium meliloti]|uniref:hypothetical protein n=1 Tax=Rhizobium meliloti TaxID=382 RepID=UPI001F303D51|nr:hypothetical protein [Sinorhizobium meliloti]
MHAVRPADCPDGKGPGSTSDSSEKREETYGINNLHLTVARGYVAKLLANTRITRWLSYHRPECLGEFQKIAEIEAMALSRRPRRRKIPYGAETWPTSIVWKGFCTAPVGC